MAALVQNGINVSRKQIVPVASAASSTLTQKAKYATKAEDIEPLKYVSVSSLKRGTGGRSSFSGIVATVFGSTGCLGPYVVNRLGKIGTQMILPYRGEYYDIHPKRVAGDLGQVLFHHYHLKDESSIRKAVKYSNVVINMVGRDWETKNFSFEEVNVEGARRLARIAREMGVEKFIHISDANASPDPAQKVIKGGSKFLKSKYAGELAVREEFPNATIIRPSMIFGNGDRFTRYFTHIFRHQGRYLPMYRKGEETVKQPVFAGDVAQAIVNAAKDRDSRGQTYLGYGPKRYRLADLVDWFHALVNRDEESWGYKRYDIKYDPTFLIRAKINEKFNLSWPIGFVHPEYIERESISDPVAVEDMTLEDIGVNLTPIEDMAPWLLRYTRTNRYYDEEMKLYHEPPPPQPIKGL
ncbi:NADH dehydrogenase [ubiquinone] 1 alpha subcomplex subunit 9, mitochondrial [Nilaparvata lugens]|uniref:NADH dehydrogenase [ubiquinone] 1 alpha subcomplex subunit 9, mitochondrial n=1 Tax=Nilaparvata lugens TaxID=108931 RepID=UPI00193DA415|nr:NADH dehydrogenase [ubiquinone] 1 alpha subcomplex subunit 9, mitochondrial [Nilaparvata lugens]